MELTISILSSAVVLIYFLYYRSKFQPAPGPFNWPILGCIFSLKYPLHLHLAKLAEIYGPVMYLQLGLVPHFIVSTATAAKEVLKVRDLEFAHRSPSSFYKALTFGYNDIAFTPLGEVRRKLKQVASQHLFNTKSLDSSSLIRQREAIRMVKNIYKRTAAAPDCELNVRRLLSEYSSCAMCVTLFGQEFVDTSDVSSIVTDLVDKITGLLVSVNIGELFPALERFDLQGLTRKYVKDIQPQLVSVLRDAMEHHKKQARSQNDNFTSVLVSLEENEAISDTQIMALLMDSIVAGLETSRIALEYAMAELINHPDIMETAQKEIDEVVGKTSFVQESQLQKLTYMQAIVKETLRLHVPGPLGFVHSNPEESTIGGCKVPANSRVMINMWAIGRDPAYWSHSEEFMPQRFLGSNVTFTGQHFEFIPFSSGRRMCPGYPLAMRSIPLVLTTLLQAYNWSGAANMEESRYSLTGQLAFPLHATVSRRLDESMLT